MADTRSARLAKDKPTIHTWFNEWLSAGANGSGGSTLNNYITQSVDLTGYLTIVGGDTRYYPRTTLDPILAEINADVHDPVTSPNSSIDIGTEQEIDVDLTHDFDWSGEHTFGADVQIGDMARPADIYPALTVGSIGAGNKAAIRLNATSFGNWALMVANAYLTDTTASPVADGSMKYSGGHYNDVTKAALYGFSGNSHDWEWHISNEEGAEDGDALTWDQIMVLDGDANTLMVNKLDTLNDAGQQFLADTSTFTGIIDVDEITSSTTLTINPTSDLHLDPDGNTTITGVQKWDQYSGEGLGGALVNWSTGYADFDEVHVQSLSADLFTLKDAEVKVGHLIVGQSASKLTQPFTIPTNTSETMYVKNIPGAGDLPAFRNGDDLALFYYDVGDGSVAGSPYVAEQEHESAIVETGGGSQIEDEDWEAYTAGDAPTGWTLTGQNNAMTTAAYWKIRSIDGTKALAAEAGAGNDTNYHAHWTGSGYATLGNVEITGRIYATGTASGRGITLFSDYPNSDEYVRIRRYSSSAYHVACHGYASPDAGTTNSGFTDTAGEWTHYKIRIEDDGSDRCDLYAKFWNENDSEPGSWQISCYWTGSSRPTEGTFGFWGYQTASVPVYYDDIEVTTLSGADVPPSVTISLNECGAIVALCQWAGSASLPTDPAYFSVAHSAELVNGVYTALFKKTSNIATGESDYTWSHADADWLAVSLFAIESTDASALTTTETVYDTASTSWLFAGGDHGDNYYHHLELLAIAGNYDSGGIASDDVTRSILSFAGDNYRVFAYESTEEGTYSQHNYYPSPAAQGVAYRVLSEGEESTLTGVKFGLAYGTVTRSTATVEDDEQAYTWITTRGPGSAVTVGAGAGVFDLGREGDAYWEANVIDGQSGGPYSQIVERGENPWDKTSKLRLGYLGGTSAYGDLGLYFKEEDVSVELSTKFQEMRNVPIRVTGEDEHEIFRIEPIRGAVVSIYADSYIGPFPTGAGYTFEEAEEGFFIANLGGLYSEVSHDNDTTELRLQSYSQPNYRNTINILAGQPQAEDAEIYLHAGDSQGSVPFAFAHLRTITNALDWLPIAEFGASDGGDSLTEVQASLVAIGDQGNERAEVTAKVSSGGTPSLTMDGAITFNDAATFSDVATYASGVVPDADQDLARIADTVRFRDIQRQITKLEGDSGSASQWVKLARVTFDAANYRAAQIHISIYTGKNNVVASDTIIAFCSMGSAVPAAPQIYAEKRLSGTSALFGEVRCIHISGTGTTAIYDVYGQYSVGYVVAYADIYALASDPSNTTIDLYDRDADDEESAAPSAGAYSYASVSSY